MRTRYLSLATSALLLLGTHFKSALADTIHYSFSALGTSATFTLPSNPTPSLIGSNFFQINNVVISISGVGTETANIDFFNTAGGGGAGSGGDHLTGAQLFSGTLSSPTLLTGTFPLSGTIVVDSEPPVQVSGNLIATVLAAVPEPSSLVLLLTAMAGATAAARRRLHSI